jgi:hypothetical protein
MPTQPPPLEARAAEPVRYVGAEQPDPRFYHGGLRHVVGVHRYQALRANRSLSPEGELQGWTYNHAPMLAYWNETYYLQYVTNQVTEHVPPGRTMLLTSRDGFGWSLPQVLFPTYSLPAIEHPEGNVAEGTPAVMHQRMGFYTAPDGRLLTLAFYSYCPNPRVGPNNGQGLGRVVREIYRDGSFGPIYFIRYNRHAGWNESNTRYPFFKTSPDAGFVAACEALLADKLMTLQWWEDDRARDGFYAIDPEEAVKALSYYHRPDGVVVALWKLQMAALSADEGHSWTPIARTPTILETFAKTWGQRTKDGRYALVYPHALNRRNRFPMVVMTGDDGHTFDNMLLLHGEVSPLRFRGIHKNLGQQYIRGIEEGNGDPPGDYLWNTYSMNKEDLWVTRTLLPISGTVAEHIHEDFQAARSPADLALWNLHVPQWAPVALVRDPADPANQCLELRDEDPYEYLVVERAFPESRQVLIEFRLRPVIIGHAQLEFEVHDRHNTRPLSLRFQPEWLVMDLLKLDPRPLPIRPNHWYTLTLRLDCDRQAYDLALNGEWVRPGIPFAQPVESVERLVWRTGAWRADVRQAIIEREPRQSGDYVEDLPGADQRVPLSVYLLDDVRTEALG